MTTPSLKELANAIRFLSMDAVQKAQSGHPGMPMGMADIALVLWNDFLCHNPKNPEWFNRDRFVVSNGHGAMLLYSLLHLSGYALTINDLKSFRQLHSKTPGHPEFGETPGVETTTGPLGQGLANAVGMALGETLLSAEYNRPDYDIIDHWTYAFVGDGCLMEGLSHEVCSLAGTLKLGKLVVFYDDNGISIDGAIQDWFQDDTTKRFEAYGWQVLSVDGHDTQAIHNAIASAKSELTRPTLIRCKTTIGFGAPTLAGSEKSHGSPLGEQEIQGARKALNWSFPPFEIPASIYQAWDASEKGQSLEKSWNALWSDYQKAYPKPAQELQQRLKDEKPKELESLFDTLLNKTHKEGQDIATRKASQLVLNAIAPHLSAFIGGSADLTESNLTAWEGCEVIRPNAVKGNYLHYGVREFGMSAIMNGLALHGGFIPFGGTFLTFLDYARNGVRMSALMKQRVIYVFSHDSIGLGEDGPTHQPIEHITMLRATPNMHTWRPADDVETVVAWQSAVMRSDGPTSLLLTRQKVPHLNREQEVLSQVARGGYVLSQERETLDVILMATGSEVALCMDAKQRLEQEGLGVRVVSVPCMEVFKNQPTAYLQKVLPAEIPKIAVEAGATLSWYQWVGLQGKVIGIDTFGASAPIADLYQAFSITVDSIVKKAKELTTSVMV